MNITLTQTNRAFPKNVSYLIQHLSMNLHNKYLSKINHVKICNDCLSNNKSYENRNKMDKYDFHFQK